MKMKKLFSFVMLGAIALAGATMFNSCTSEDAVPVNPTFDGEAVKTQFSISLPGNVAQTRMDADVVQEGAATNLTKFRGMQDIVIIPYAHATNRDARLGNNITLAANTMVVPTGASNAANGIPTGKLLSTTNNAVLYNDVTIPVGTSAFLFYGKATGADGYPNGALTAAGLTGQSNEIFFNPTQIQATPVKTVGEALAAYVTAIANAKDATDNTISWYACTQSANSTQPWYSAALGDMYTSFTSLKPGASAYVQAAVQDLYTSIKNNTDKVSVAIKTAILTKAADNAGNLEFDSSLGTVDASHRGYPYDDNNSMPEGCATLSWTAATSTTDAKAEATPSITNTDPNDVTNTHTQAMDRVAYPASLYYFVDSPVKASITSRQADYKAASDWATILATYTNGTSVASTTRSVAITKPIQYAVGRLDLTVNKLDAAKYYDRRGEEVAIPADGFQLTGVLIGGQKKVDYKFEQVTSADEYAIYDKTINGTTVYLSTTAATATNYTLALETATDQIVYVAVEFLNNSGKDFMGYDGVVKAGCKFYMIAKLDPTATTGVTNPTTETKVFLQDYKTIATFTFGPGSQDLLTNGTSTATPDGIADTPGGFANAYVTIPDLRTPKLELGFSVDLTWRPGIEFTYTF